MTRLLLAFFLSGCVIGGSHGVSKPQGERCSYTPKEGELRCVGNILFTEVFIDGNPISD